MDGGWENENAVLKIMCMTLVVIQRMEFPLSRLSAAFLMSLGVYLPPYLYPYSSM